MPTQSALQPTAAAETANAPAPETIRLQATSGFGRVLDPKELWRFRDLAFQIAARDVTIRYRQTAFGAAWAILQPLAFMAIFTLIFGRLAGIEAPDGLPYALFALVGLVPWMFFANSFLLGSESLVMNQALISKIYFPRIFIPAGVVAAGCVDFTISLLIMLTIVLIAGFVPPLAILALPLLIAIAIMTALGAAAGLSAVNVRYRDVRYVVPFATQLWFFITPIVYPNVNIDEPLRTLTAINPMVGVVEGFRWAVLGAGSAPWDLIGISFASACVLLFIGLSYFDRVERSFADLI
ncbi:MAG TPA: ABC transporter permease [Solirubrobacterales bacterium]|nr:ABC transporter permease [Solirubrobacterales bacterium]